MSLCARCGFQSAYVFEACPNCLDPTTPVTIIEPPDAVRLSSVPIEPVEVCVTGTPFDAIGEIGVPQGAAILLSGPAGSGKSTWGLRIAEHWHGHAWYCPYERGVEALRRDAERLHVELEKIWVCAQDAVPFRFASPTGVLIIDSLNEYATTQTIDLVEAARTLTAHANRTTTTVIMVAHVTKEWDVAGSERIKHAVDVWVEVIPNDESNPTPMQVLRCMQKNRYGPMWQTIAKVPWSL